MQQDITESLSNRFIRRTSIISYHSLISFILVVYETSKFLTTGHECEYDNPNVAHFKLNKNRPQRLSFIANVDLKTDKQEEWCIRNWVGYQLQVTPDCNSNNPFTTLQLPEVYFIETA